MPFPKTSDGRIIYLFSKFRGDVDPQDCGADDDGNDFCLGWDTPPVGADDLSLEWQFHDWVYVAAGSIRWSGAEAGDSISMKLSAKASTLTANVGAGNCDKNNTGLPPGAHIVLPAAGDGDWDIDLSADSAAPVIVPAFDASGEPNGYWDWDEPNTGRGTVSAGAPGASPWNLFDFDIDLVKWVRHKQLIGSGVEVVDPHTKARKIPPQWTWRVDLHTGGGHSMHAAWGLSTGRKDTLA